MASSQTATRVRGAQLYRPRVEDEEHIREAIDAIERGEFIEISLEQLELCAETGEFPWTDESRD